MRRGESKQGFIASRRRHTRYGRDAIIAAEKTLDAPESFLCTARDIAYCHHEKWDGTGYPQGLKGTEIPLAARLMAIADVYDALISKRGYKEPKPHEKAVEIITQGRGSHFDPEVTDAFLEIQGTFADIARKFNEEE